MGVRRIANLWDKALKQVEEWDQKHILSVMLMLALFIIGLGVQSYFFQGKLEPVLTALSYIFPFTGAVYAWHYNAKREREVYIREKHLEFLKEAYRKVSRAKLAGFTNHQGEKLLLEAECYEAIDLIYFYGSPKLRQLADEWSYYKNTRDPESYREKLGDLLAQIRRQLLVEIKEKISGEK